MSYTNLNMIPKNISNKRTVGELDIVKIKDFWVCILPIGGKDYSKDLKRDL